MQHKATEQPLQLSAPKDVYGIVTGQIISQLEKGTVPWRKPWTDAGIPRNLISKRPYRGINLMLLSIPGYEQNLFLTYRQVQAIGGHIRKGEHGHLVVFWNYFQPSNGQDEEPQASEEAQADMEAPSEESSRRQKKAPMLRYYVVFNVAQCEGIPKERIPVLTRTAHNPIPLCEEMVKKMPLRPAIRYGGGQGAYYDLLEDSVQMPKPEFFISAESFYATLFHELVHSTGHRCRVGRKGLEQMEELDPTEAYSHEELVAEIGSCYLLSFAGITSEMEQSASYIQGWLKKLRSDTRFIFSAAAQAQKATDFILNLPGEVMAEQVQKPKPGIRRAFCCECIMHYCKCLRLAVSLSSMKQALVFLLILIPYKSFSWGRAGHQIVAEIAMHYLPQSIKDSVIAELAGTSPEDAATWMDDMRANSAYDYMKPWHYINIPKGESYRPGESDNLITALNHAFADIQQNRVGKQRRKQDIQILFHLIGDMHQPLHDGYASDKGGNTIAVNFGGRTTNLHHAWDSEIISSRGITADKCLAYAKTLSRADVQSIQHGNFVSWMEDSQSLLPEVYNFPDHNLDSRYLQKSQTIIERQLVKAGIRLAHVLELLFSADHRTANAFDIGSETVSGGISSQETEEVPAPQHPMRTYTPEQAAQHIGEIAIVCGKVCGGKYLKASEVTFINLGAPYPMSPLTIVVFGKDRAHFSAAPETEYDGATVCVTGRISNYKGRAEIVVSDETQIKIQGR